MIRNKVNNVLKKMLSTRGYNEIKEITKELTITNDMICYYPDNNKITIELVKNFFEYLEKYKTKHGIIVYNESLTPDANALISEYLPDDYWIEIFCSENLTFIPIDHKLVPLHVRLTSEEIKLELANIRLNDLPEILDSDPIIKFMGYRKDDIIRVHRINDELYYLIVVRDL